MFRDTVINMPPKVSAVLSYLEYCRNKESERYQHDGVVEGKELTGQEEQVRKSALEVLNLYFRGDLDFDKTGSISLDDDDDPPARVPCQL